MKNKLCDDEISLFRQTAKLYLLQLVNTLTVICPGRVPLFPHSLTNLQMYIIPHFERFIEETKCV